MVCGTQQDDPVDAGLPTIGVGHDVVEFEARGGPTALAARAHVSALPIRAQPDGASHGRGNSARGCFDGFRSSGSLTRPSAKRLSVPGRTRSGTSSGRGSGAGGLLSDGWAGGRAAGATASAALRGARRHPTRSIAALRARLRSVRAAASRRPVSQGRRTSLFAPSARPTSGAQTLEQQHQRLVEDGRGIPVGDGVAQKRAGAAEPFARRRSSSSAPCSARAPVAPRRRAAAGTLSKRPPAARRRARPARQRDQPAAHRSPPPSRRRAACVPTTMAHREGRPRRGGPAACGRRGGRPAGAGGGPRAARPRACSCRAPSRGPRGDCPRSGAAPGA